MGDRLAPWAAIVFSFSFLSFFLLLTLDIMRAGLWGSLEIRMTAAESSVEKKKLVIMLHRWVDHYIPYTDRRKEDCDRKDWQGISLLVRRRMGISRKMQFTGLLAHRTDR